MNILVVEDDPTSLKLVHLILEADGHAVKSVDAPDKALASIAAEMPAVILVDLALPGMDGLSLTRRLKGDPATSAIPVVAITSYPDRFPQREVMKAGCDAYIVKPIDTRTLPKRLEEIVSQKSAARE